MKLTIRLRFFIIANIPMLITIAAVALLAVTSLKQSARDRLDLYRESLLHEKMEALKNETEIAVKTITQFYNQENSEASKEAAMTMIKNLQFGEDGYFWINDYLPRMVMHPHKPALDGKDLRDFKDPNDVYLFKEMVSKVNKNGSGFVPYMWPKPGHDDPQPKISYVKGFKEWNWIIGTGIYIDDIDRAVQSQKRTINKEINKLIYLVIGVGLALFFIFGIIMYFMVDKGFYRRVQMLIKTVETVEHDSNFSQRVTIPGNDEITETGDAFNDFLEKLDESLKAIGMVMNSVAMGNLSQRVSGDQKGDLLAMKNATNQSIVMLSQTILEVRKIAEQVFEGVQEVAYSSQSLASGSSNQASAVQEIASQLSNVVEQAKITAKGSTEARNLAGNSMGVVEDGKKQMEILLSAMQKIDQTTSEVSSIIKVIDEIAFQTNLLSLNAAVEAARAGKYGKGFAVVAEEVRRLANRSAEAARNTSELIENAVSQVKTGVENTDKTASVLNDIFESVKKLNEIANEVSKASSAQTSAIDEINSGLEQVNQVVLQNSSISEETASASQELTSQTTQLKDLVSQFHLDRKDTIIEQAEIKATNDDNLLLEQQLEAEKKYLESSK